MVLDMVNAVEAEKKAKPNEGLIKNSIKLKKESDERVRRKALALMAERDARIAALNEEIAKEVANDVPREVIAGQNFDAAAKIQSLEKEIYLLGITQGPIEQYGNRAIRLIGKMINNARANSDMIYKSIEEKPNKSYDGVSLVETVEQAEKEAIAKGITNSVIHSSSADAAPVVGTPVVDIQQVAQENQQSIGESIDTAIRDESLEYKDVKDVVDEFIPKEKNPSVSDVNEVGYESTATEEQIQPVFVDDANKEKVNERLNQFISSGVEEKETEPEIEKADTIPVVEKVSNVVPEKSDNEDYTYKRMTDDEIAASQININSTPVVSEFPLRDEPVIVPEREIKEEEQKLEVAEEDKQPVIEVARSITVPQDSITKYSEYKGLTFEQLQEMLAAKENKSRELKENLDNSDQKLAEAKAGYAEIIESETAAKERNAKLYEEKKQAETRAKEMMMDTIFSIDVENGNMTESIRANQQECDNIKTASDEVTSRISKLDSEAEAAQEEINKFKEIQKMLGADEEPNQAAAGNMMIK